MFGILIDKNSSNSLIKQFCNQFRALIIDGHIKGNTKLPPTRTLAQEYLVSRNVIVEVYEQLKSEGYLYSIIGSGTFVNQDIKRLYKPEKKIIKNDFKKHDINFINFIKASGSPDMHYFPSKKWNECYSLSTNISNYESFVNKSIQGNYDLRKHICEYIYKTKGIEADNDQIFVTSGITDACLLLSYVFSKDYNNIVVENPSIISLKNIFEMNNYKLHPVNTDEEGLMVNQIIQNNKFLALVTPSHQYPTGSILSIKRRLNLIDVVKSSNSYILEDDYDGEFRFKGSLIPPLQTLSPENVIYMATFNKTMFSGIKLGYIVAPVKLVEQIRKIKINLNLTPSSIIQRTMYYFIYLGYYEKHIYKMKKIYSAKSAFIENKLNEVFGKKIMIEHNSTGVHLSVIFNENEYPEIDWENINWKKTEDFGIKINSFKDYSQNFQNPNNKIVLGYGDLSIQNINKGIELLAEFINSFN